MLVKHGQQLHIFRCADLALQQAHVGSGFQVPGTVGGSSRSGELNGLTYISDM